MSDAIIGREVDGYRIQSVLGRGGMGTVYKAEDVNLSRTVAIKRINPSQSDRETFIHRFRSEAQALARIDSPHIVGVYALRETEVGLLIVMEYVEGGTLKDPLERQGPMAPGQAIPVLEQILKAFHDAHSAGVIHRDIKPQNIMLTRNGMVKVTDFGIAKLRQPDSGETVTQGGRGGTLKYMSPEQISNISAVDARSDLYSIGMTAYEMLAGDLPFQASDSDFDIMRKVVEGEIPPPDEFNPDIPSGLAQWVVRAIRKHQDDRYQSAEAMFDALREADQQGEATVTQPEWEIDDGGADVDQTQTVAPGNDRARTVPSGADDETDGVDPPGETVVEGAAPPETSAPGQTGTPGQADPTQPAPTKPAVPPGDSASDSASGPPASATDNGGTTNWAVVGGGVLLVLLITVGAWIALTQMGGGAGPSAALSLTTTPAGATVFVNGDTAGTTPLRDHALAAGPVTLRVQKGGYEPVDTSLTVEAGDRVALLGVTLTRTTGDDAPRTAGAHTETRTEAATGGAPERTGSAADPSDRDPASSGPSTPDASAPADRPDGTEPTSPPTSNATPATGRVQVAARPVGTVLVGGQPRSTGEDIALPAGQHTITCRHPQGGSTDTTLTVAEGQTRSLTCHTEHTVNVNTKGPFGRIWLNGTDTGKNTNAGASFSLPPGTHQIEVRRRSMDGYSVNGGDVQIERGEKSQIKSFSGSSYQVEVRPTFEQIEYAILFNVGGT